MLFLKCKGSDEHVRISNAKQGMQAKLYNIKTKEKTHGHQTEQYRQLQKWMWSVMAGWIHALQT